MIRRARSLPILWQTLLLLLAALTVSQAILIGLLLSLRPPRPDFNGLGDVAQALAGRAEPRQGERALHPLRQPSPPSPSDGMTSDPGLTAQLAQRIGTRPDRVRLFFEPDQHGSFPFRRRQEGIVPVRHGEPLFFNTVVAGLATPSGWRVVATPPRPWTSAWQRRTMLWFALSALALLPFAWFFARALTRPIRRFADAADRMGQDPLSPRVPEEGPAELRIAGQALNGMQARLADYLAERTAMIGAIAHDLRTPLARIAFRIEGAPDAVREKVQADIEQMRAMLAATIGFARGTTRSAVTQDVDLAELIGRMAADEYELGHAVTADLRDSALVRGDPVALERLLQNLVDNALRHAGDGGVTIGLTAGPDAAEVTVADRGPGVPDGEMARMFVPFERGDPSRSRATGGIGLGLTIARAIAQGHGATLTLANRTGGGLIATLRLPMR